MYPAEGALPHPFIQRNERLGDSALSEGVLVRQEYCQIGKGKQGLP